MVGLEIAKICAQIYLLPFIKVTHDKFLNGRYEIIFGWFKWELIIRL
jgi:hypothetical protein